MSIVQDALALSAPTNHAAALSTPVFWSIRKIKQRVYKNNVNLCEDFSEKIYKLENVKNLHNLHD